MNQTQTWDEQELLRIKNLFQISFKTGNDCKTLYNLLKKNGQFINLFQTYIQSIFQEKNLINFFENCEFMSFKEKDLIIKKSIFPNKSKIFILSGTIGLNKTTQTNQSSHDQNSHAEVLTNRSEINILFPDVQENFETKKQLQINKERKLSIVKSANILITEGGVNNELNTINHTSENNLLNPKFLKKSQYAVKIAHQSVSFMDENLDPQRKSFLQKEKGKFFKSVQKVQAFNSTIDPPKVNSFNAPVKNEVFTLKLNKGDILDSDTLPVSKTLKYNAFATSNCDLIVIKIENLQKKIFGNNDEKQAKLNNLILKSLKLCLPSNSLVFHKISKQTKVVLIEDQIIER